MTDFARGRDFFIKCMYTDADGNTELLPIGAPVNATFNQTVTNDYDPRLGDDDPDTTQIYTGESGTVTVRHDSGIILRIQDLIREADAANVKMPEFQIVKTTRIIETAETITHVYPGVRFEISENISSRDDAAEVTINWIGKKAYRL